MRILFLLFYVCAQIENIKTSLSLKKNYIILLNRLNNIMSLYLIKYEQPKLKLLRIILNGNIYFLVDNINDA